MTTLRDHKHFARAVAALSCQCERSDFIVEADTPSNCVVGSYRCAHKLITEPSGRLRHATATRANRSIPVAPAAEGKAFVTEKVAKLSMPLAGNG